ncbi:MAG: class A beta-lactamase-related serine hydrolase [bacterium]|nr:class A beta-lactamase-related serine hydrolase [bacterium]
MKKLLFILGGIITILALIIGITFFYFSPNKNHVLSYIAKHPETTSITLFRNGKLIADQSSDEMRPLASTVKIMIAIEYAVQASEEIFNPDSMIALVELDRFYFQGSDGGAHPAWLNTIEADSATIREIAQGMIRYSSNANTDWLSAFLGLENINRRITSLGIKNHSEIYYLVSSLFIAHERFPTIEGEPLIDSLQSLTQKEYVDLSDEIHQKLVADTSYMSGVPLIGLDAQKVWSDRLPASTTNEYAQLMRKLNSKTYFSKQTHHYFDEVMESLMENPANQEWLSHAGMKGGSTAFVLTKALYAKDKDGETTELAYFLDGLTLIESIRLQGSLNAFELAILTDDEFLGKVAERIGINSN